MRRILFGAMLLMTGVSVNAQYKKSTVFTKGGRTYDAGISQHFMGGGRSTATGIIISFGTQKPKRAFHWFDFEAILPYNVNAPVIDKSQTNFVPVIQKAKTSSTLLLRYNWAINLLNNQNEKNKVLPFLTAGINVSISGNTFKFNENDPYYFQADPYLAEGGVAYGANVGVGVVYNFSENIGLKLTGGYNLEGNAGDETPTYSIRYEQYNPIPKTHPYVTATIRFSIKSDE